MPTEIGSALREARLRQQVDIGAVEAATKIRAKYLRALENEEWEVLPGPAYARSFLRTYANFLSLDGEVLVDEYRRRYEAPDPGAAYPVVEPVLRRPRRSSAGERPPVRRPRLSGGALAGIGAVAIVAILLVLGLTAGSSDHGLKGNRQHAAAGRPTPARAGAPGEEPNPKPSTVSVSVKPQQDVWVCLVDDSRRARVNGVTLTPGNTEGPFKAKRFDVTFGNGFVTMQVDGKDVSVPDSASPVGYEITPGRVRPLDPSARPTCS
jgi:hypothetical protein